MRKLKLEPDALRVETFVPHLVRDDRPGTVRARDRPTRTKGARSRASTGTTTAAT